MSPFSVVSDSDQAIRSIPHVKRGEGIGKFLRLPPEWTGVDFTCELDPDHPLRQIYFSGYVCGGVAVGDLDNDGLVDLFLVSGRDQNRLYRQTGNLQFEDVTERSGVGGGDRWGTGAALIDIDNDHDLDIYVCNYDAPNQLFINSGDATFVEAAKQWGIDVADASIFPAFSDLDRDGDLDLYLLTNQFQRPGGRPAAPPFRMVDGRPEILPEFAKYYTLTEREPGKYGIDTYGRDDYLFVNDGMGRFQEATQVAGIHGHGNGLSATWFDYDNDGWPDLYVCNDFDEPDRLYRNQGNGTFVDCLSEAVRHTTWFSMGSDAADINNDGLLDLFVLDMSGTDHFTQKTTMGAMNVQRLASVAGPPPQLMRNALHLNVGGGRFMETAYLFGVADSNWSWAAKLADFDNDGWVDLFVSNGVVRNFSDSDVGFSRDMLIGHTEWEIYDHTGPRREQNLAFRNNGDLSFEDVSQAWGLDHLGMSYGAAWSDLDHDGDLDLIVANVDEPISIFRNDLASANRVSFRLVGRSSNRYGLGARVEVTTSRGTQTRELSPMTGFVSCNEPVLHFGLDKETVIQRVKVTWPNQTVQQFEQLAANHHYVVTEPATADGEHAIAADAPPPMFRRSTQFPAIAHLEDHFDDFAEQELLPNRLSQFGPGMAWGDIDRDGDDDLFVGNGAGYPASLWRNDGGEGFRQLESSALASHAHFEDLGALFFDANGDDRLDLYVVSGGTLPEAFQDRLYLQQETGEFVYEPAALPTETLSGSTIASADFDRDGDLDLFVGSRLVPGQYPLAPRSQLLRNDGGHFTDVIDVAAHELAAAGMVTSAVWSNINGDDWPDLAVAYEWGPIRIFLNQQGSLRDATAAMGIGAFTGWWNGLGAGDLDNDGDNDLIATNAGLNTKYHASPERPALLYYGDFDRSGRFNLIEAEYEGEQVFPVRGKSCSTHAMPVLGERFTSYRDFALADLAQIYTSECLQEALRMETTTLASCVFRNDGARFTVLPLPRLAQSSASFGAALSDVDGDGWQDLYLVQNFFGPQPETGRWDSGVSLLMHGLGDGQFSPIWPNQSGLFVSDDAKGVAVVDLNVDARPDFVVSCNQGPTVAFICGDRHLTDSRRLIVRLDGPTGNPTGVGATVYLHLSDGTRQMREIHAGSGYLTQHAPAAFFAWNSHTEPKTIEVHWAHGERTRLAVERGKTSYVVRP